MYHEYWYHQGRTYQAKNIDPTKNIRKLSLPTDKRNATVILDIEDNKVEPLLKKPANHVRISTYSITYLENTIRSKKVQQTKKKTS